MYVFYFFILYLLSVCISYGLVVLTAFSICFNSFGEPYQKCGITKALPGEHKNLWLIYTRNKVTFHNLICVMTLQQINICASS